jgi:Raf kinase inhibitor-like YbhB/YbcL family protein
MRCFARDTPHISSMDLQHTMRSLIRGLPRLAVGGVPAERAGAERLVCRRLHAKESTMQLFADFSNGAAIPVEHAADGPGLPVPLSWSGVPPRARSLCLLVEDPDAPTPNPFLHWAVYDIPPGAEDIGQALAMGSKVGRNSMLRPAWAPCAPPKGDEAHRYVFQLFALTRELGLAPNCGRSAIVDAMHGCILGVNLLVGTFRR